MIRAVLLTLLASTACAEYPSTFPITYEGYTSVELKDTTPSFTFDENDPGGYIRYGFEYADLNDCPFPWGYHCYAGWDNYFFVQWGVTASPSDTALPRSQWNCSGTPALTAEPQKYTKEDFTGSLTGLDIECKKTQCCSAFMGHYKYLTDQLSRHDTLASQLSAGGCSGSMHEDLYCFLIDTPDACMDYYPSKDTRTIVKPCPDVPYVFYMSCTLYKAAGLADDYEVSNFEPASYLDGVTVEQTLKMKALINFHDRLCYPMGYYDSEFVAEDDSAGFSTAVGYAFIGTLLATVM
mmetsp:Transcript_1769/g.6161  ORF Transcript_1769/g.6161 Transcript_1769/m.6161 type:complete len:294 (+) Transcript_1769:42-923(+)|eukprot:CAMPEP_0183789830 /NCGR_PEP_ID=MMETSP0803_2-20130417/667_1 /TAXON_ID=195967 /ORGANISM="Crustomastix stigmata, Strain CCMP3273" /LENGTH=293 /DNA_ID=CAMNT_0026034011 /DNA_START=42 /DNA_END=923 /DNA_ORIENTATION=+